MPNLLASLCVAAESMKAYEQALAVIQNNVTNATTPGYVRQQVDLVALAFQPDLELTGGVRAGTPISSRSVFSERAVWRQSERNGRLGQTVQGLSQIEPIFDIGEGSGIAGAMNRLYDNFSRLSVTPNDVPSRQNVINQAGDVARAFNFAATSLAGAAENSRREIRSTVGDVNRLANVIRDLNIEYRTDFRKQEDAGLNARLYNALEELATLVDFNALLKPDGTVTILMGGQTTLVIGDKSFPISADTSGTETAIRDGEGKDITGQVQQGKLKGALELSNELLPGYTAELNLLAETFADRVNAVLAGGIDLNGLPPVTDLFEYDAVNGSAITLAVTNITPEEIAAASPAAPGGNSNALALAELATSAEVGGFTFTEFYGEISGKLGNDLRSARQDEQSSALLLSQAWYLRDQESAVDRNEEAASLIEYQRAYQATAQLVRTLDEMTEVVMTLLR
jgi:flagellar hook-associated protein 1 FlgK